MSSYCAMNIFSILFGLLLLAAMVIGTVAVLIALFTKRWKTAGGIVIFFMAGWLFLTVLHTVTGPFVKGPVAIDKLAGTYRLQEDSWVRLEKMGYKIKTGTIILNSNGSYTGTDIPACCIHGKDERHYPFTGGYYGISGTWKIEEGDDGGGARVSLDLPKPILSDAHVGIDSNLQNERMVPFRVDSVIMKGRPYELGFSIFNGDFDYIIFEPSM